MKDVSTNDLIARVRRDNPWWQNGQASQLQTANLPRRIYFAPFAALATDRSVRRATVLMGPRRVGKTVMMLQLAEQLVGQGHNSRRLLYASIDAPIYSQLTLEQFLEFFEEHPRDQPAKEYTVLLDEVQYLENWETHLKDLVDNYHNVKFVVSGSAAAALRLASEESGAGRFSDFRLPPLTFAEFLQFIGQEDDLIDEEKSAGLYSTSNIDRLNEEFVNYLNYGGYPEAVLNESVRNNTDQFVRNDIIDKVLLKDLPALYGIQNIQELNRLFAHIAYNNGNEISLTSITQKAGVVRGTIARYVEYLESAFLLQKVSRVDQSARKFQRERNFKVYLTNPSMRAALFSPVPATETALVGQLAEAAAYSQWSHRSGFRDLYYARWQDAEIDMLHLGGPDLSPSWATEIKWSDRPLQNPGRELKGLKKFLQDGMLESAICTTRTLREDKEMWGGTIRFIPTSIYCYTIGKNVTNRLVNTTHPSSTPR